MKLVQWVVNNLSSMLTKEYIEVSDYTSVSIPVLSALTGSNLQFKNPTAQPLTEAKRVSAQEFVEVLANEVQPKEEQKQIAEEEVLDKLKRLIQEESAKIKALREQHGKAPGRYDALLETALEIIKKIPEFKAYFYLFDNEVRGEKNLQALQAKLATLMIQQLFLAEIDSLNAKHFSVNQCPLIKKYSQDTHVALNEAIYHGLERVLNRVKSFEDLVVNAQSFLYLILKIETHNSYLIEFRQKCEKVLNEAPKVNNGYQLPAMNQDPRPLLFSSEARDGVESVEDNALAQAASAQPASKDKKKVKK